MTLTRRHTLRGAAALLAGLALAGVAPAQTASKGSGQAYPNRPLRFIVPFSPGSTSDTVARILATKLTEQLGQQIIVDARPGGVGIIGIEIAKHAPPDGYTLLLAGITALALLPALKPNLPYDPDKDFVALSRIITSSNAVVVKLVWRTTFRGDVCISGSVVLVNEDRILANR